MATVSIDQQKCVRCGKCLEVCPLGILKAGGGGVPYPEHQELCIACGHCAAYCPSEAISIGSGFPANKFPSKTISLTPEILAGYMRQRRSVRNYTWQAVDRETVESILEVVRFAPTGINRQEVKWIIFQNAQEVQQIAGLVAEWIRTLPDIPETEHVREALRIWDEGKDSICRGAPHLAIAYADSNTPLDVTDTVIAMTYFELSLPAYGLGGCWAGFVHHAAANYAPLREFLGVDPNKNAFAGMLFGYPRDSITSVPRRKAADVQWR